MSRDISKLSGEEAKQIFSVLQPNAKLDHIDDSTDPQTAKAAIKEASKVLKILVPKSWLIQIGLKSSHILIYEEMGQLQDATENAKKLMALALYFAKNQDGYSINDLATFLLETHAEDTIKDHIVAAICRVLPLNDFFKLFDILAAKEAIDAFPAGKKDFLRGSEYASKLFLQFADKACENYTKSLVITAQGFVDAKLRLLLTSDKEKHDAVMKQFESRSDIPADNQDANNLLNETVDFILQQIMSRPPVIPPATRLLLFHARTIMENRAAELGEPLNGKLHNAVTIAMNLHGLFFLRIVNAALFDVQNSKDASQQCKNILTLVTKRIQKFATKIAAGEPEAEFVRNFLFQISTQCDCFDEYLPVTGMNDKQIAKNAADLYEEHKNATVNILNPKFRSRLVTGVSLPLSPRATVKIQAKVASPRDFDQTTEETPRSSALDSARGLVTNAGPQMTATGSGTNHVETDPDTDDDAAEEAARQPLRTRSASVIADEIRRQQLRDPTGTGVSNIPAPGYQVSASNSAPGNEEDDTVEVLVRSKRKICPPTSLQTRNGAHAAIGVAGIGTAVGLNPAVLNGIGTDTAKQMAQALIDRGLSGPGGVIWTVMILVIALVLHLTNEVVYRKASCRGFTFSSDDGDDGEKTPLSDRSVNDNAQPEGVRNTH